MLHEFDAALGERGGVLFRPHDGFGLFEDGATVLDDELELRVEAAELDVKAS